MDFQSYNHEESVQEKQAIKQATYDEIVARHTLALQKELGNNGGKLISRPQAARVAVNPVSQMEYNCRKYALLNIIRNVELSETRYPLADSWRTLYPNIPYNEKATNWNLSKGDREELIAVMKEEGVWKHTELTRVKHFIERVHTYHLANKVIALEKRVKTLELQLADNGNIWYRGVEIIKLARTFKVTIGEVVIETRHGTFDKLFEFLTNIDARLS